MKKKIPLIIAMAGISLAFVGCQKGGNEEIGVIKNNEAKNQNTDEALKNPKVLKIGSKKNADDKKEEVRLALEDENKAIDIDLTKLSSTIVFTEVYNMMVSPKDYMAKKIKISGSYAYAKDEKTNKEYFAVINKDALACCAQGIEFEPKDMKKYMENPIKDNEHIVVTGIFDTYTEGNLTYCVLRNATIER